MRQAVLEVLRERPGEYVSGEELSRRLVISRTAVWKHVRALRAEGYNIEARAHQGYRFLGAPDRLYPEELQRGLATRLLGQKVVYRERVGSTNELARELAEAGAPEGTLVVAEEQTGGRGRLGRTWVSPYGLGIWMSLVLRPRLTPARASHVTLLAAVAAARAVEEVAGVEVGVKWPNDLYAGRQKLCGILTELKGQADAVDYLVLGVGMNVNQEAADFPAELREQVTSLRLLRGGPVDRRRLVQHLLAELEVRYFPWQEEGREEWLAEWRRYSVTLGREVEVNFLGEAFRGQAVDVDRDGALLVRGERGEVRRFLAGDVTLGH